MEFLGISCHGQEAARMAKTRKKHAAKNTAGSYDVSHLIFNFLGHRGGDHRKQPEWRGISQKGQGSARMVKNQQEWLGISQHNKESARKWQGVRQNG